MNKLIIILILLNFNLLSFSQNKFGLEIDSGLNFTSVNLDKLYYVTTDNIETYDIQGGIGYNIRIGTNYNVLSKFSLNTNITFTNSNYKYFIYDKLVPGTPIPVVHSGVTNLDIHNKSIGFSFGPAIEVFKNIFLKYYISYNKIFHQKTEIEIKYSNWSTPNYEEKTETWSDLKSELTSTLEFSINYMQFCFNPGFEYSFHKIKFNPSNNTGNKYRYYFLIGYIFK